MIGIILTLHGNFRKAKTRPMMTPKSQLSQRQKCEYILHSKVNRNKFREELKGELVKMPNHTDLPSVLDRVVSTCEIVDRPVVKTDCWARFITSEGWGILKKREVAYRTYLQDRKNPALAQILRTNNQLAKTVTKRAREKALEADLAKFARLKDIEDLRGAYRQLKVTLRFNNISWFERGRKSVGPLKQDFPKWNSELFKATPAPGDDGIERTATLTTQTPLAPSESVNAQEVLVEERRLSANPTNDDGRGTQRQLVRALPLPQEVWWEEGLQNGRSRALDQCLLRSGHVHLPIIEKCHLDMDVSDWRGRWKPCKKWSLPMNHPLTLLPLNDICSTMLEIDN